MDPEGPGPEDLRRFGGETARCPECSAEIWDDAERCPRCGSWVDGPAMGRTALEGWLKKRWLLLVTLAAVAALLLAFLGRIPSLFSP